MKKYWLLLSLLFLVSYQSVANNQQSSVVSEPSAIILTSGEAIVIDHKKNLTDSITAIKISNIQFESMLIAGCGKGLFLFGDRDIHHLLTPKQYDLLIGQYTNQNREPTAFSFKQGNNEFYLNVTNNKIIDQFCQNSHNEINVLNNGLLIEMLINGKWHRSVVVTDIREYKG